MRSLLSKSLLLTALIGITSARSLGQDPTASQAQNQTSPDITVKIDGDPVSFDFQQPVFRGDRVMIPLRGTLQKLGVEVRWDAAKETVYAKRGNDRVVLHVGDIRAWRNDQPFDLHVPALIIHGTTMVPLRFVSQSFGAKVDWHEDTHVVEIHTDVAN